MSKKNGLKKLNKINLCDSIKAILNIKKIFSYLSNAKKLKLIIYSRKYQNKLRLDIENYKLESWKYKIGKKDELGKEFKLNTEILLYEGRYKNGKRNGKGKEYNDKGNLIFKGIFIDGKKLNGYLKEYYDNGNIKYKGEIIKGIKNGKGKEYFDNNKVKDINDINNYIFNYEYNKLTNFNSKISSLRNKNRLNI